MNLPSSWIVKYTGLQNSDMFTQCFSSLGFNHFVLNKASTALHVFNGKASVGGKFILPQIYQAAIQQKKDPFQFQVTGIDGTKAPKQSHVILKAFTSYARNEMCTLTLLTADVLSTINVTSKSKAYKAKSGKVSDVVKQVLSDEGLNLDISQDSEASADFPKDLSVLHQPYITSWRWIVDHLIPKSGGMWCLYSPDGTSVNFAPPWYKAKTCTPPNEAVLKVREIDNGYDSASAGGYDTYGETIDPLTKELVKGDATGEPKAFNSYEPRWKSLRTVETPIPDLVRESDQSAESYPYNFEVTMHGSDAYNGIPLTPPLIIDLSNCKYRLGEAGAAKGVLVEAFHLVERGQYTVKCTVKTDGFTS